MAVTIPLRFQVCFQALLRFIRQHNNIIAIISCGFMFGSSIALPMLSTTFVNSGGRGLLWITAITYIVSAVSFASLKKAEIVSNGLYTTPWTAIPVLYMVHSPEKSMYQFMSMVPFWVAIGLVLTITFTPEARRFVQQIRRLVMDPITTGVGSDGSVRTDLGTVDPDSVYSFGPSGLPLGPIPSMDYADNLEHIGAHLDDPFYAGRPRFRDLEMGSDTYDTIMVSSNDSNFALLQLEG